MYLGRKTCLKGRRGHRKLVMAVRDISQHFKKIDSPTSSPKRKNNENPELQSPAKLLRRKLDHENLRQYWDETPGSSSNNEKIKNLRTFGPLTGNLGSLSSGQSLTTEESEIISSDQLKE